MSLSPKIPKKLLINVAAFLVGFIAATTARADISPSQNTLYTGSFILVQSK